MRFILLVGLLVLVAVPARADDFYAYEMHGKTWVSNYCPKKARNCRRIMKGWSSSTPEKRAEAQKEKAATARHKRREKRWKPPRSVRFSDGEEKPAPGTTDVHRIVGIAATTYNLPEAFIHAVITVESSYKTKALSYKGAMGLMQLMPGTAADLGVDDPYDPYQNVMGGAKFLRILANRFNGDIPKVLAAFHAGGHAVSRAGGIPYQGSDGYVRKVLDNYYRLKTELDTDSVAAND